MTQDSSRSLSRRQFVASASTAGALALAGCTQSTDPGENGTNETDGSEGGGQVSIAGSSTVFPLATAMKEEYQSENDTEVNISVQSTGSGGGFQNNFCPGRTDFNNASRPIQPPEEELCSENGVEPVELKVATDALTVIVNNGADWVDCITVEELAQIWSADEQPEQWSDVNDDWPDEELQLFGPTEASGTFDYFNEAVLGEEGPDHRMDHQATERDREIVQGVRGNDYAIGYLGFAYYSESTDEVKALGIDDGDGCVEPSLETAKNGEYTPLSRPLFTYVAQSSLSREPVADFAQYWLENATSEKIVAEDVGYVPLGEDEQSEQLDVLESAIDAAE